MKKLLLVTNDKFLSRKIALAVDDTVNFRCLHSPSSDEYFDVCLWDIDTSGEPIFAENTYTLSRERECDIAVPFTYARLSELVSGEGGREALLECRGRTAYLRGEAIKLTELEATLLSRLISAGGEFVSREVLLSEVFASDAGESMINVYVHYLREKLERGEKIIISSRKSGYKIDGRYIGCSE